MSWWLNGHFGASPAAARTLNALVCGIGILSIACEAEKCILTSSSCFALQRRVLRKALRMLLAACMYLGQLRVSRWSVSEGV
jgi:hypothetical protein